jgi:uncharacterized protein YndB with AHSA1/START domain
MSTISIDQSSKAGITPGGVEVTRAVRASAVRAWNTLTEPEIVARWFGNLTSALRVGDRTTLEFGDGDFFVLDVLRMEAPHTLQYVWRFLGIGPPDTITWRINSRDDGCLLTVTDNEDGRTREAARQLRKGWLDFTERLEDFLRTGQATRYNWRHELDASIELAAKRKTAWEMLFDAQSSQQWLPLSRSLLEADASIRIDDGLQPSEFQIQDAQYSLTSKEWLSPTSCSLELSPRGRKTLLSISNNGWESISVDSEYQKQQRKRFCEFWIDTLKRARALVH